MRLSMDPADEGFNERLGRRATITLNGEPVANCITADEEAGFVIVRVVDAAGKASRGPRGGYFTQRIDGDVRIEISRARQ